MYPNQHSTPLYGLLLLVRQQWLVIVGVAVIMAAASVGASMVREPVYVSTAILGLGPQYVSQNGSAPPDVSDQQLATQVMMVTSTEVSARARELGATGEVSASTPVRSSAIAISGRGASPETAQRTADGYAKAYIQYRERQARQALDAAAKQLQERLSALDAEIANATGGTRSSSAAARAAAQADRAGRVSQQQALRTDLGQLQVTSALVTGGVTWITVPERPTAPVSPQPIRDGLLAGVLGFVLGVGLAFLRQSMRPAIVRMPIDDLPARTERIGSAA